MELEASDSFEGDVLQSKIFVQLGLVVGMFEKLRIGDRTDEETTLGFEERNVSIGREMKALFLTGLGFVQQQLYLTAELFEKMLTDRIITKEVRTGHLNGDMLGWVFEINL